MEVAASIAPNDWILPALLLEMLAASSVSRPCDNRVLLLENAPLKAKVAAPNDWICPALLALNARIFMVPARIPPPLTWKTELLPLAVPARLNREPACARSEEHTSELQSLMRISNAAYCLEQKTQHKHTQQ